MRAKQKSKKKISEGIAYIQATFNNTIVTFTDLKGNVVCYSSAGMAGFKHSRKPTPHAGQVTATEAGKKAREFGMNTIEVRVQGPGAGRESAIRALAAIGFKITKLIDITKLPHNGPRPPKGRRV